MLEEEEEKEENFAFTTAMAQYWRKYLLALELFPTTGGLSSLTSLVMCTNMVAYKDATKEWVHEVH